MTKFETFLIDQISNFNIYHSNLLKEITEEDIHKLRTTLKKIKTINIVLNNFLFREKDFPIELAKLFKETGEIRDIHIQQNIDEWDNKYKKYLSEIYNFKISNFSINNSYQNELNYLLNKMIKVNLHYTEDEIIEGIEDKINICLDEISNTEISPENLHDIRKKIKNIFYIFMILNNDIIFNNLDKIQETIGLWHDYDVLINNMKNFDDGLEIDNLIEKRDLLYNESVELIKDIKYAQ